MKYIIFDLQIRLKTAFSARARKRRMDEFLNRMNIKGGERIIDLGGTPAYWQNCPIPVEVWILNLPGENPAAPEDTIHSIHMIEGDACNVEAYGDQTFDITFSNSVIEHVGDKVKQAEMAREVQRLAPAYWVQTPSIWFPIEAHTMVPFWWFYPKFLKDRLIVRWRKKLPAWTEMVETTTVLLRDHFAGLFPGSTVWTERKFLFPKSYVAYKATK